MAIDWTNPETVETFKRLWRAHTPTKEILALPEFKGGTRSALTGKAGRLGLPAQRPNSRAVEGRQRATEAEIAARAKASSIKASTLPADPDAIRAAEERGAKAIAGFDVQEIGPHNRTILEEGFGGCRWPVGENGDGETLFCCAKAERDASGRQYCDPHKARAYQVRTMPAAQHAKMVDARAARTSRVL